MSKLAKQNAEVYEEITTSGKSLLQLYMEVKAGGGSFELKSPYISK